MGRKPDATQGRVSEIDRRSKLRGAGRREVAPPERRLADRRRRHAEHGDVARAVAGADLCVDPQDGNLPARVAPQGRDTVRVRERRPQVRRLLQHRVGRCCEASLVGLRAHQRRAVAEREGRQPDADEQERCGGARVAGVARERERGQPSPHRKPARAALEEPDDGAEQPDREDGGHESDQGRKQEEQHARPTLVGELVRVGGAARERERDRRQRAHGGEV